MGMEPLLTPPTRRGSTVSLHAILRCMKELRATIRGQVQGVGFRGFVDAHARELGLLGYVQNQADGSVYCVAQGEEPALHKLEARLRRGPSHAEVVEVDAEWVEPSEEFASFDIRKQA